MLVIAIALCNRKYAIIISDIVLKVDMYPVDKSNMIALAGLNPSLSYENAAVKRLEKEYLKL